MLSQTARIQQRAVDVVDVLLQLVDERTLVVRLEADDLGAKVTPECDDGLIDLGECRRTVDVGLASTEQVEVRPVKDEESHGSPP